MENSKSEELISGLATAFIDQSSNSNLAYRPEFIYNDHKQGKKVLVSLEQELKRCDEFFISVAFITDSGFESLSMILKELEQKGVSGKILTTDYLTFSQPKALDRLAKLKNIELKMFRTNSEVGGFHTKGYIFREDELYRIIIGSSNMTSSAITKNREWNTKIVSTEQGEVAQEILNEFNNLWMSPNSQYYEKFIDDYKEQYLQNQIIKKQQRQAVKEQIVDFESYKLKPNKMQLAFINNLMEMRSEGIEKALLLSSTGTGKTYASAFAVRELGYQKVLFLVHRNQIAEQALKSYQKVFGPSVKMGLVTGKYHDYDADFIFATVQTLSKTENLERFARDHFECCIYDEAHHTSADSYKKVMDYFTPQFTLGMTATPDKRDDHIEGRNIYEIFDHNIAYEIRLQKAMEEDLLCPFHYFGITDLEIVDDTMVNGNKLTKEEKLQNFRFLTSDERVKYVIEQAEYYGYSGNRVKGLIFCSRIEEANELSKKFNEHGWRTLALSGADSEEVRRDAIERLVNDDINELDYILSVDIFSEGVDVPEINQVIMLRPTQSPIVFIQQLGRGLRKAEDKEYVVILDFIGNYKNIGRMYEDTYAYSLDMRSIRGSRKIYLFIQGSYANNTNVRTQSDVDIAVVQEDIFTTEYRSSTSLYPQTDSDYGFTVAPVEEKTFKDEVQECLEQKFGSDVERKNKSIKIHGNTYRKDADSVPCRRYRDYRGDYQKDINNYIPGVVITPDHGSRIINYPEQHIANGRKKNNDTNRYYKKMVRIIKKMRYLMCEYGYEEAEKVSSFGLESLLWNLPDNLFMRYSIYRYEFREIVEYLYKHKDEFSSYKEANGIKKLCPTTTEIINYKKFVDRLYQFYEYDIKEEA